MRGRSWVDSRPCPVRIELIGPLVLLGFWTVLILLNIASNARARKRARGTGVIPHQSSSVDIAIVVLVLALIQAGLNHLVGFLGDGAIALLHVGVIVAVIVRRIRSGSW